MHTRGFTLMEVLVAAALSAVVVMLVATAIRSSLRATEMRRAQIDEARLARAILHRIADDLRAAVQYKAVDFSGVEGLAAAGSLGELELDEEGLPIDGFSEIPADPAAAENEAQSIASGYAPPPTPGVYGNRYELQVDISRLPRVEEYSTLILDDSLGLMDPPSDIKTVAYYLLQGSPMSGGAGALGGGFGAAYLPPTMQPLGPPTDRDLVEQQRGLIRRSLDRAVTLYAVEIGDESSLDFAGQLLAPEVVGLEFRYTDGQQWYEEWNTETQGGLPLAVQIAIALSSQPEDENDPLAEPLVPTDLMTNFTSDLGPQASGNVRVYRLTVRLPLAEPSSPAGETLDMEALAP